MTVSLASIIALSGSLLSAACGSDEDQPADTVTDTNPAGPGFGSDDDVADAEALWSAIEGYQQWQSFPGKEGIQEGGSPHGAYVQFFINDTCAADPKDPAYGSIIIKENYADEAGEQLGAITVMEKREGYDPEGADWFWVKYKPDGTIDASPDGVPLAGKVGGCRSCHEGAAPDRVFVN